MTGQVPQRLRAVSNAQVPAPVADVVKRVTVPAPLAIVSPRTGRAHRDDCSCLMCKPAKGAQ